MGKNLANLLILSTEYEYKEVYISEFLKKDVFTHDGKRIAFREGNFHHMFFRDKETSTPRFDKKLAQRMLQIKDILLFNVSDVEVYENDNCITGAKERAYIFVYGKLCIHLRYESSGKNLFPVTAYIRNNAELKKFRESRYNKRIK